MPHAFSFHFDNAFVRDLPGDPESGSRLRQVEGALWSARRPHGRGGAAAGRAFA